MNLKAYLANIDMKMYEFAQIIECDPKYLCCVMKGKKFAGKRLAKDIEAATGGVVKIPRRKKTEPQSAQQEPR